MNVKNRLKTHLVTFLQKALARLTSNPTTAFRDWKKIQEIGGGFSGCRSFLVTGKDSDMKYFMKFLDDNDSERRVRFHRETVMYQTLKVTRIPKVIESNSHLFEEKAVPLYYVCEFIEGKTLDSFIQKTKLTETEIVQLVTDLLEILKQVHHQLAVHRDIKPQNIIIAPDKTVFLVDFGIAYMDFEDTADFRTEKGQELGNRFLRISDYAPGSMNKRSPQSDLTLWCGIATYLIGGQTPRVLQDTDGKFPHQRKAVTVKLKSFTYASLWNLIFDRGFLVNFAHRWSNADEILLLLNNMKPEKNNTQEFRKILDAHAKAIDISRMQSLETGLNNVYLPVKSAIKNFIAREGKAFRSEQSEHVYIANTEFRQGQHRIYTLKDNKRLDIDIYVEVAGGQIVGYIAFDQGERNEIIRIVFGEEPRTTELEMLDLQLEKLLLPKMVAKLAD
jgi:serine/threonine-protein kinase